MRATVRGIPFLVGVVIWASSPRVFPAEGKPTPQREELFRNLTKNLSQGTPIELRTLEIRARIYEPQVIYVLDRSKIDVDFREEPVTFTPRIGDPIRENAF